VAGTWGEVYFGELPLHIRPDRPISSAGINHLAVNLKLWSHKWVLRCDQISASHRFPALAHATAPAFRRLRRHRSRRSPNPLNAGSHHQIPPNWASVHQRQQMDGGGWWGSYQACGREGIEEEGGRGRISERHRLAGSCGGARRGPRAASHHSGGRRWRRWRQGEGGTAWEQCPKIEIEDGANA
jgi:hypothetical protein